MRDLFNWTDELLNEVLQYKVRPMSPEDLQALTDKASALCDVRNSIIESRKRGFEEMINKLMDEGTVESWHYNGAFVVRFRTMIETEPCLKAEEIKAEVNKNIKE